VRGSNRTSGAPSAPCHPRIGVAARALQPAALAVGYDGGMRDVWILAVAQALAGSGTIMLFTFGGIIGTELAPFPAIATLPLSLSILGVALTSIPAALLMQRIGRRAAFVGSAVVAALAALLCATSVATGSFAGLCVSGWLLGSNMAFVQ